MAMWLPILTALVAACATMGVAIVTIRSQGLKQTTELLFQKKKFEEELNAQRERLAAEFATEASVEAALRSFLSLTQLRYRTFPMIRHHVGGFSSNELRKFLVRAGAIRFMAADGTELWALRERVAADFQAGRWQHRDEPENKVPESSLFPGFFQDATEF